MQLIGLSELKERVFRLNELAAGREVDLLLVGGAAVLALAGGGEATRDLDALRTPGLESLERALGPAWVQYVQEAQLNSQADVFQVFLAPGREERCRYHPDISRGSVRVFTPSPEDLVVMKIFRLNSKDAQDIRRLAAIPGFDRQQLRRLFKSLLPVTVGDPERHAQSFAMVWSALYPEMPMTSRDVWDGELPY